MFVNGHIYPAADSLIGAPLGRAALLSSDPCCSHNDREMEISSEVQPVKGSGLAGVLSARGAAFGDLFNNGKIDVVINQIDGPPVLLKNVNADHHHWVEMKLVGGPRSPRDAVVRRSILTANGIRHRQDVISGGSYVSTNDPRLHFGLGDSKDAGTAEIHWPSGERKRSNCPRLIVSTRSRKEPVSRARCALAKSARIRLLKKQRPQNRTVELCGISACGGKLGSPVKGAKLPKQKRYCARWPGEGGVPEQLP